MVYIALGGRRTGWAHTACREGLSVRKSDEDGAVLKAGAATLQAAGENRTLCPGEHEQAVELAVHAAARVTLP